MIASAGVASTGADRRTTVTAFRDRIGFAQEMPDMAGADDREARASSRKEDLDGPAVVAYTTEDDEHGPVREAAQAHARDHGCVVVLYAADAAGFLSEPMPNAIDAEGAGDRFGDRLGLADLEYLGRSDIAGQVADGRRAGARVAAWLPKDHGLGALAEYALAQDAHLVYLPAQLGSADELGALFRAPKGSTTVVRSDPEVRVVGPSIR